MDFCHKHEISSVNVEKKILDTAKCKASSKKVVHKAAEATGKLIRNKIANKVVKPKPVPNENSRNVEEIIIPPEKREEILNKSGQLL